VELFKMFLAKTDNPPSEWFVDFNLAPLNPIKRILIGKRNIYKTPDFAIPEIEEFIKSTKVKINHEYSHRFYTTYSFKYYPFICIPHRWDCEIYVPDPSLFLGNDIDKQKLYYYGLFHEMTHWSGCEENLNRPNIFDKNKFYYAEEEIVATLGARILLQYFKIYDKDLEERIDLYLKSYLESWIYGLVSRREVKYSKDMDLTEYQEQFLKLIDTANKAVDFLLYGEK